MNISQVVAKLETAEEQFAEESLANNLSIGQLAETIMGIEKMDLLPLVKQMVQHGSLPPDPNISVTAAQAAASMISGILIGLRAVQLTELDELESIPTLSE